MRALFDQRSLSISLSPSAALHSVSKQLNTHKRLYSCVRIDLVTTDISHPHNNLGSLLILMQISLGFSELSSFSVCRDAGVAAAVHAAAGAGALSVLAAAAKDEDEDGHDHDEGEHSAHDVPEMTGRRAEP